MIVASECGPSATPAGRAATPGRPGGCSVRPPGSPRRLSFVGLVHQRPAPGHARPLGRDPALHVDDLLGDVLARPPCGTAACPAPASSREDRVVPLLRAPAARRARSRAVSSTPLGGLVRRRGRPRPRPPLRAAASAFGDVLDLDGERRGADDVGCGREPAPASAAAAPPRRRVAGVRRRRRRAAAAPRAARLRRALRRPAPHVAASAPQPRQRERRRQRARRPAARARERCPCVRAHRRSPQGRW